MFYNSTYGVNVRRAQTFVWSTNSVNASNLVSIADTSTDGLRTWQITYRDASTPATNLTRTVFAGGGNRYVTNTAPDSSYVVSAYSYGRLSTVTRYSSTGAQLGKSTYTYDPHGRQYQVIDARNGATTYGYNNADQVTGVTTPAPGTGQAAQTTLSSYNTMLQVTDVVQPDGASVTNEFYQTGLLKRTYGSRTYPVGYGYDAQGRMTTMTNWTGFAAGAGARVTTWNYDAYRGWLSNKRYPDNNGPDYTYTQGGRMKTRQWARIGTGSQRILTTYSYGFDDGLSNNDFGDQVGVTYTYDPQSTPALTYTYDRRGRQSTIAFNGMTTTLTFNDANQLLKETNSAGTLGGFWLTNTYDGYLRRASVSALTSTGQLLSSNAHAFDYASRLTNVTDGTFSAGYTYLANSPMISQVTFKQNSTTRMTTSKQFDYLNRLQSISSAPGAANQLSLAYNYQYNNANQRTRVTLNDGSFWIYQYDALGQVKSGKKYFNDNTPVPGQQFEYGFDDIGNRSSTKAGGDATGSSASLRSATYGANSLNQYTNRTVPNALDVLGIATASASVTVNSSAADYRRGEYFQELVSVTNSSVPLWQAVNVTTSGGGTNTGNVFVPQTPENYGYDADGNMTNDGRWTFTWDAENRLVSMQAISTVPSGAKKKLDFAYDYQGRRIQKVVSTWIGTNYVAQSTNKFLYDGWNLSAELNGTNGVVRAYLWGLDLSGSMQGAGGVSGLLAIKPAGANPLFVAYDGNGNVTSLIDATTGTTMGNFEYGPFGETIRLTPNANNQSPFRFSTKYTDDESDFVYYGFRFYNPSMGRWLSRDPIAEQGGTNLYGFLINNSLNAFDLLGQVIVGFYGADTSYRWPNEGNQVLEMLSSFMALYEPVLRPRSPWRSLPLYHSRADGEAFSDLLRYLDTNNDGKYNPPCDREQPIEIFGWSWGGASAVELANRIKNSSKFERKYVEVVAVIDPVTAFRPGNHTVPDTVRSFWNRYQRNGPNVLPLGLPNHGDQLKIADPILTSVDQLQLDPNGPVPGLDHVTIVSLVAGEFLFQLLQ